LDNPANQDAVRDAGGIGVLVGLARYGTDAQKEKAAMALMCVGLEPAELGELTVPVLKGLCAEFGLSKTGVKADLVARLCPKICSEGPPRKKPRMDLEVRTSSMLPPTLRCACSSRLLACTFRGCEL
jgi:hypothetical protein